MEDAVEIWAILPDDPRYLVSTLGRVYSRLCHRVLRPGRKPSGHYSVALGRGNSRDVHHLVLIAFRGPRPPGHEGLHTDDEGSNNRLSNLSWGTRGKNSQDKKWNKGQKSYKLSGDKARELKKRIARGERKSSLAKEYGIHLNTVYAISQGRFHCDV